jgi:hypothetical protein
MATFLLKLKQKILAIFSIEYQWIAYRTETCVNDYKNQSLVQFPVPTGGWYHDLVEDSILARGSTCR